MAASAPDNAYIVVIEKASGLRSADNTVSDAITGAFGSSDPYVVISAPFVPLPGGLNERTDHITVPSHER